MSAGALNNNELTRGITDWLTAQPFPDPHVEVRALSRHINSLHTPEISEAQFARCIELFYGRAIHITSEVRRELRETALPLKVEWQESSALLITSLQQLAQGFVRLQRNPERSNGPRQSETASARALRLLGELYIISHQTGNEPSNALWTCALGLYQMANSAMNGEGNDTAQFNYKRLLALSALDPESFSPGELDWAAEYTARVCAQLTLQNTPPGAQERQLWHWLNAATPKPQAMHRQIPPEGQPALYFSTSALARKAGELLSRHEDNLAGPELEPAEAFPGVQPASLLLRMKERWQIPAKRELPRRKQQYMIEACVGLPRIWKLLHSNEAASEDFLSKWEVINESPGGYAIMQIQGNSNGLAAGTIIALRRNKEDGWSICIVRWLRSGTNANQLEVGLQILAQGAVPVRIGFRSNDRKTPLAEALVLPVFPALRQHQAILAPAGTYNGRRFTLVSDIDRLYIAQARLLNLDLQTSNIEVFQFEIDPYPL